MNIPPKFIERWVQKNFDYKRRVGRRGPELVIANPFHDNDKKKFNISLEKAICHDWRGDDWAPVSPRTGDRNCSFIKFVQLFRNCSYQAAILEIFGASGKALLYAESQNKPAVTEFKESQTVALPEGSKPLATSDDIQAILLIKWLGSRGYSLKDIEYYKLYYSGMDVIWPYFEYGEIVYWQSRSSLNKSFNYPPLDKDFLYGFDDIEPASYLILTESIFDKHTLGDQVVATGGAILVEGQIKRIKILGPKNGIILSPDNDKAGIKSIIDNARILEAAGFNIWYSIPPREYNGFEIKDWNDLLVKSKLSRTEIHELHFDNIIRYDSQSKVVLNRHCS